MLHLSRMSQGVPHGILKCIPQLGFCALIIPPYLMAGAKLQGHLDDTTKDREVRGAAHDGSRLLWNSTLPFANTTISLDIYFKNYAPKRIVWPSPLQEESPHLPRTTEPLLHPNKHKKLLGLPWKAVFQMGQDR